MCSAAAWEPTRAGGLVPDLGAATPLTREVRAEAVRQ
jgi:hypothetical protein